MDFADLGRPDQYRVEKTGDGESDWEISYPIPSSINAVGYVTQTLRDMQEEMDELQGDLFVANIDKEVSEPTDVERCIEFRKNYFDDMCGYTDEFERFEPLFSFKRPYTSEDPHARFLDLPSATALEAFIRF